MSSYSFSHQFSQRWTRAPDSVRAAIVQELKDITSLLQTSTPFEEFVFSTHDLDAHLDELYATYNAEQAAEKQAAEQEAAEQARLAKEKQIAEQQAKALADSERKETELKQQQTVQKEQNKKDAEKNSNATSDIEQKQKSDNSSNSSTDIKPSTYNDDVQNIISKPLKGAAIDLSISDPKLSTTYEGLISELEMQVDDYLSEQMTQMSEDLKSWLRAEISQQLASMTDNNTKTQNLPPPKDETLDNNDNDKNSDKSSTKE